MDLSTTRRIDTFGSIESLPYLRGLPLLKHKPFFSRVADSIAFGASRPAATMLVSLGIIVWLMCGFFFHFDEKWQLVISTLGTVITLLMVFVIQHSQENDSAALHIKLDEIIRVLVEADNQLLDLEKASQGDLEELRSTYHARAAQARDSALRDEATIEK